MIITRPLKVCVVFGTVLVLGVLGSESERVLHPVNTGMADASALVNAFDKFPGSGTVLVLSLSNLRGLTSESANAGGKVTVDMTSGAVSSEVTGLPRGGSFELWLIDNRPGVLRTTFAEAGDDLLKVGTFIEVSGLYRLAASLRPAAPAGFFPDRAFVVRSGQTPVNSFVLTGSSTLFDRVHHRQARLVDAATAAFGFDPRSPATRAANFTKLVAQGRRLFLEEKFNGNGRACGTCHIESNNFTIDPDFIATLPANNPLFVAEKNSALAGLEDPDMMRRFGLILVNADGFDPSRRFTLRSTQNVQALSNSTTPQDPSFGIDFSSNGRNPDPPERLGWGNDGAPLRDFALVAIVQHAPKTLKRRPGLDFRVPTDEELDALVAYQLALGRQEDFNLPALELKSALANQGRELYLDTGTIGEPGHKNCNACHFNGGGTAGLSFNPTTPGFPDMDGSPRGFNIGAATGANDTPVALSLRLPRDGGFGQILTVFGSFGNTDDLPPPFGHFELEEFNSPPVVESADTGPFFHNHTVKDLESAVAFYGTPAFQSSLVPAAIPVKISGDPNDLEVQAISAFLRVLNALENIRSSINVAERGRQTGTSEDARELAILALAETVDALQVLSSGALAKSREVSVLTARIHLFAAKIALELGSRLHSHQLIEHALDQAIRSLRAARSALANPVTLPVSYRN